MAGFVAPIIGGIGSLLGGIFGGNSARNAGRTIGAAGTATANQVQKDASAGAQEIKDAVAGGAQNFDWAKGGVDQAVASGQGGVTGAGQSAIAGIYGAKDDANSTAYTLLGQQQANLTPYIQNGIGGINKAGQMVGEGFHAPTAAEAEATPGFQFQLQQGLNGLTQQFGANGGAATGGALKALTQYGQGVASTYYQNAFNNALNTYNTNLGGALALGQQGLSANAMNDQATQNFGNIYNSNTMGAAKYAGDVGIGTAEYGAGLGMQGAGIDANLLTGKANYQLGGVEAANNFGLQGDVAAGNFRMQGAEGTAAGQIGQANAWSGAASGVGNAFMSGLPPSMGGTNFGFGGGNPYGGSYPGATPPFLPGSNPYGGSGALGWGEW